MSYIDRIDSTHTHTETDSVLLACIHSIENQKSVLCEYENQLFSKKKISKKMTNNNKGVDNGTAIAIDIAKKNERKREKNMK